MDIWHKIIKRETLYLLESWNPQFVDESFDFVYELVFNAVELISRDGHSKEMNEFIGKCDMSIKYKDVEFYLDRNQKINTEVAYNTFIALFIAREIPVKVIKKYKVNGSGITFFQKLIRQLEENRNIRKFSLKETLKQQIIENMPIDRLCDLDGQNQEIFEILCQIYFYENLSLSFYNLLVENSLKKLLLDFRNGQIIHKKWFLEMSDIIINEYLGFVDISHQTLLNKIKAYIKNSKVVEEEQSYANYLFGDRELNSIFDDNEIFLFFDNDLTLNKIKKQTDEMLQDRFLKRHVVSEFVFNRMNECSGNKNCKFDCPFNECKYKNLLSLLGSHLTHYDIVMINDVIGGEDLSSFLFVIKESEDELQLALCTNRIHPPSPTLLFDIRKTQYQDAVFLLIRYFESDYSLKRKNLIPNFLRFGRFFGILLSRTYRK